MFDIKYYKKYLDTCYLLASFGSFYNPTPYFDRVSITSMLSSFFLITICSHCFQYVFIFSVWVSILSNCNQLHIATCLENEWGSLKLVHFETVRINRGPQNKLLQNSMFSLSIFFLDIIGKLICLTTIIQQRNSAFIRNIVTVCIIPLASLKLVIRGYSKKGAEIICPKFSYCPGFRPFKNAQ